MFYPRGQELLEYALILPFFLMLAFGIIDLGLAAYSYSALQNAAREGARYAIVNACNDAGTITLVGAALG
jgi:Flp pilus assembly protein TadG